MGTNTDQRNTYLIAAAAIDKSDDTKAVIYHRSEAIPPARVAINNKGPKQIRAFWRDLDWQIPAGAAVVLDLAGAGTLRVRVDEVGGAEFTAIIQTLSTHS